MSGFLLPRRWPSWLLILILLIINSLNEPWFVADPSVIQLVSFLLLSSALGCNYILPIHDLLEGTHPPTGFLRFSKEYLRRNRNVSNVSDDDVGWNFSHH
jgi:hypothetical protein